MSSAPDSERAITFGFFSLLGIALQPRLLLTKLARWRGGSGAWLLFFSFFLFLWGRRHSEDTEKGAGMGLPIGLFLFQLKGLPCLRSGGSGQWMQSCRQVRSSGRLPCSLPRLFSSPLTLPGVVYGAPGVLASGSSLAASA